jgi:hypothetical protein
MSNGYDVIAISGGRESRHQMKTRGESHRPIACRDPCAPSRGIQNEPDDV